MTSPRIEFLPNGDDGTLRTVERMRGVVIESLAHPLVRWHGVNLARGAMPGNVASQIGAIRGFLTERVHFLPDPVSVEWITHPASLLRTIDQRVYTMADCDDVAVLGASLGGVIGIPSRFVLVGFFTPAQPFQHVYTELFDGREWKELDVTRSQQQIGFAPPARELVVPVIE